MQAKSVVLVMVLLSGLLAGCGGATTEDEAEFLGAGEVEQANTCVQDCDTRLNNCLRSGSPPACFQRHHECVEMCPIEDADTRVQAQ